VREDFDCARRGGCPEEGGKAFEAPGKVVVDHLAFFGPEPDNDGILQGLSGLGLLLVIGK